jgi:hypothetical protein
LREFQRVQQGLRAVLASSIRVSIIPYADFLPHYRIFTPLADPLEEVFTGGPLIVTASVYANPWWEIIQTFLPYATVGAAVAAGFKNAEGLINIAAKIATFRDDVWARRKKLRSEAARSELEELRALAEQAELGLEVRRAFSEGRHVGNELSRHGDVELTKQVATGVAADTLINAVAEIPTDATARPPELKVITAEVAREGTQAAQELIATQDISSKTTSAVGPDAPDAH